MKETTTIITATITKITKVEDGTETVLPAKEDAEKYIKDMLNADDVQVTKVKNFVIEE